MERQGLYERFKNLEWQQQLGNLASTLATVSTQSTIQQQDKLTCHLLREAALMIEWCAKDVPVDFHLELAAIQKECLAWRRAFPIETARSLLSIHARHQSERLLQIAGLLSKEMERI
jgi:hypothetical protein